MSVDYENERKSETFRQYLNHRYQGNCYFYSTYALMGLQPEDCLVRGKIDIGEPFSFHPFAHEFFPNSNYYHGWVEFSFEGEEYVFDPLLRNYIICKIDYEVSRFPVVDFRQTQKEILQNYLSPSFSKEENGIYTISLPPNLTKERHVSVPLNRAKVELDKDTQKVKRFIAHSAISA